MAAPNRYNLGRVYIYNLASTVVTAMADDPYWSVSYSDIVPKPFSSINRGSMIFKNKMDPSLYFMLNVNSFNNHFIQPGFYESEAGTIVADIVRDAQYPGVYASTPITASNVSNISYFQLTVLTTNNFIYLNGEGDGTADQYPLRLYAGRLKPYESEDPLIANDFVGLFTHFPVGNNSSDYTAYANGSKNVGRGFVRRSRNGTKNHIYNFTTNSQLVSPGVGGRFFISPFYIYDNAEGVRGEFFDMYTVCFRDGTAYPDGSVLSVGNDKYYIFHVVDQIPPSNFQTSGAQSNGATTQGRWYFFDTAVLHTSSDKPQRAILVKI
ncbi:hypothetical protein [Paenibacillus sp. P46E]|uniref:hypothetical protein n=1 Tax=Paenibacillus sp. P46E TaxID=1349436 RepID=UPI00093DB6D2|nr:hypothetical protein [Paenibacillus sp. P46E]OKP97875.1 hypothetical protein A3849_13265 [Paenibacillus sp. P46E]